ncbi:MAG: membrane protein insertase YidC [Candidatus Nanopelagicales bacterium]
MFILDWLRTAVSWILVQFHSLLSTVMDPGAGVTWVLSIVGLVIVIRILLIPLFVKQIKSQRNLQLIQPQMKEIQKKYAGDRERQSQEMMKLYRETGTNPLASCLPILLQAPIFFALFSVLQGIATNTPQGVFQWPQYAAQFESAREAVFLGVPLYGTFLGAAETPNPTATHILTLILIILMSTTTFITQRQLIVKNTAPDNPIVRQQKILLYVFPLVFAVGGINFPVGVLVYWFTTNLWSMGQQFYVIRNNPQPGTPAYEAWQQRKAEKAARKAGGSGAAEVTGAGTTGSGSTASGAGTTGSGSAVGTAEEPPTPTRVQPKRQSRAKRSGPPPKKR